MTALWLLLDGTNYAHRDYHAAGAARVGETMQRRLAALQETFQPDRIAVAFDGPTCWRKEVEPMYKGNRPPRPDDLAQALDDAEHAAIVEACDVLTVDGWEADDILATLCRIGLERDRKIVIGSADKDLHQLLCPGRVTQLLEVRRDRDRLACKWMTAERHLPDANLFSLPGKYGVTHSQWIDYRSMIGDDSDNLSGVPDFGPKTAVKVLQSVGSLDQFYADPFKASITQKQSTKLFNAKPIVMHMRRLMTLRADVPVPEWEVV